MAAKKRRLPARVALLAGREALGLAVCPSLFPFSHSCHSYSLKLPSRR